MTVKLGVNFISQKYKVCISITIWNHSEVYVDIFKYAYVSLKLIVFCLFFFFFKSSCLLAVSIGWEGGVYVQTCGHTLHIDCHKSYMESLRVSWFKDVYIFLGIKYFYSIYSNILYIPVHLRWFWLPFKLCSLVIPWPL